LASYISHFAYGAGNGCLIVLYFWRTYCGLSIDLS
jgi:hypothetical protein